MKSLEKKSSSCRRTDTALLAYRKRPIVDERDQGKLFVAKLHISSLNLILGNTFVLYLFFVPI